jgi:hypothetical protein
MIRRCTADNLHHYGLGWSGSVADEGRKWRLVIRLLGLPVFHDGVWYAFQVPSFTLTVMTCRDTPDHESHDRPPCIFRLVVFRSFEGGVGIDGWKGVKRTVE